MRALTSPSCCVTVSSLVWRRARGPLYPGKNGVNPCEFIVRNGEVGVETRQKEAAAFRIQFGMPVGWNEVGKIFTDNAVITQTQRQLSASAPPQAKKALISVGSGFSFGCTMGTWVEGLHCLASMSASVFPGEQP